MTNFRLVMAGDLNNYGVLFGGQLLRWVDEFAWIAATLDFPDCNFVTIGMDKVEFRKPAHTGDVLRFEAEQNRLGSTSVTYRVSVFRHKQGGDSSILIFTTHVTLVRVDQDGNKKKINGC